MINLTLFIFSPDYTCKSNYRYYIILHNIGSTGFYDALRRTFATRFRKDVILVDTMWQFGLYRFHILIIKL